MMATVSVIIPTHNGQDLLLPCLAALQRQTRMADEIIVVDDASTDGTAAAARAQFPGITVLQLAQNGGFCRAANAGLRAARGELLCLLNDDTEVDENWIAALARAAQEYPTMGFYASKMLFFNRRDTINSAGLFMRTDGVARDIGFGEPDGPAFATPRLVFGASGGAALYRRALLDDIGLFDEDLTAYTEDVDLSLRAQLRGWSCLYVPTAIVYHRMGASFGLDSPRKVYYGSRNMLTVVLKDLPGRLLFRYSLRILAVQVYQILYNLRRGRGRAAAVGKIDALRQARRTFTKRKMIQGTTSVTAAHIAALLSLPSRL